MRVLVYDTETGGLDHSKHSVFSVGALVGDIRTGEIIDQFEAYHRLPSADDYVYTARAMEVHGITIAEAMEKGLPTEEICERFSDMYFKHGAAILGGHNEFFDRCFMSSQIFKVSLPEFNANFTHRSLDSLPIVRVATASDNVKAGASLTQAIKLFNINMDDFGKNKFHAALFDAACCFRLLHKVHTVMSAPDVLERLMK